jgi:excinuclease ABC subunit A
MSEKNLIIKGARQNNLRNIDLVLPHNRVIAVTGVSGSGKSSLAFDTVFAEGQWRFIESLSTYARLFLEKLDRPDVDEIHNIRPAIALEQKNPVRGSRSTVGTLTELYDLFRLLYAKIATPFCPVCSKEIRMWDPSQIIAELLENYPGEKALVVFRATEEVESLRKRGFYRVWHDGEVRDFDSFSGESPRLSSNIPFDIVLDRLVIRGGSRLSDSVEMAWREGHGKIKVIIVGDKGVIPLVFSSKNACDSCDIEITPPYPLLFSFNHPVGACPECKGFGNILNYDEDLIIPDKNLSLGQGAVDPWNKLAYRWWKKQILKNAAKEGFDVDKPYSAFTGREKQLLFKGSSGFYGIDDFFEAMEGKRYKLHVRVFLSRYRRPVPCPVCRGKRLQRDALSYRISGLDIADISMKPVSELFEFFRDPDLSPFQKDIAKEILRQITLKIGFLKRVGLDYLTLSRDGRTLSGGEYQRVNLSNQIASFLTGTLYVLDEPTVGLHARDTEIVAGIMSELSGLGNTILVVEHDRGVIGSADWVVELGPGGGDQGGDVIFSGSKDEFQDADTLTSRYIKGTEKITSLTRTSRSVHGSRIILTGASGNNLKSIDLEIPLYTLTTVTGVSGSGKSSLIVQTLHRILAREFKVSQDIPLPYKKIEGTQYLKGVKFISQTPIGRSPRSNPVTYLKIFDLIRNLFSEQPEARAHGYTPGYFSFNVSGGRCEACKGAGFQKMEMYFFEDLYVKCDVCNGKRYKPEALRVTCRGKNIHDILNVTVDDAMDLFRDVPKVCNKLQLMQDIGLGYIRLGQPATALSGGEAQRLKICAEMMNMPVGSGAVVHDAKRKGFLYILDEPTIGLHFRDVGALLQILQRLVDAGNTIVVIEHNLDVIKVSDWIIDLGPEGGDRGGGIVFSGRPEEIIHVKESHTGRYLREGFY